MTKFIPLVPTMTSDTTPSGECGATSVLSGFPAYYAFNGTTYDRTISGRYWSATNGIEQYIYYKFTSKKKVAHFKFKSSEASGTADNNTTCVLIASDNGELWSEIQTYNIVAKAVQLGVLYELDVDKSKQGEYLYYGIKFPSWPQGNAQAGEVQFYEEENPDLIIANPVMTDFTTPSGEVSASSTYSDSYGTRYAWWAFTHEVVQDIFKNWAAGAQGSGQWIQYKFPQKEKIVQVDWYYRWNQDAEIKQVQILASNDGSTWTDLGTFNITAGQGVETALKIQYPGYYKYYRFVGTVVNGWYSVARIDLLKLKDKHSKETGDTAAIRDWLNASIYNKEEIEDLFLQNNSGLQAYDLTITNGEPEQFIKMVGQTSGKVYNLCLAALMGDSMGKAKIYDPVINSDVLNNIDGKIFVKGNIAFCNVQPNYKTTGSSNKHIFTIPEEIRPCSFVTFETGDGAHTNACGYGYIDPTDGKVYTSNEHNNYQYMSMCWLIPDETVNFKSQDSSIESMLGGVIGIIGKDMAYISTKVHLGSHASGWKVPLLELPESIAPVNNYDFIPVVRMLSAVNGNVNSFRDAHYELNNDKCCVNVFVYDGDYDIWVTGYWKFK